MQSLAEPRDRLFAHSNEEEGFWQDEKTAHMQAIFVLCDDVMVAVQDGLEALTVHTELGG